MTTERPAGSPGDLWISAVLLGAQSILYIVYPQLADPWEYWLFSGSACLFLAAFLWETRHLVTRRTMHVVHWLILLDTLAEGTIQPSISKAPRENLYCVAAFAIVIALYRFSIGLTERRRPAGAPQPVE